MHIVSFHLSCWSSILSQMEIFLLFLEIKKLRLRKFKYFWKSAHKAPSSFTSKTNCTKFVYGGLCKMKYDKLLNFLPSGRQNIQRTTMHCLYMQKVWQVHCKWGDSWSCLICSCRQVAAFVSWILLVKRKMQNFILVHTFQVYKRVHYLTQVSWFMAPSNLPMHRQFAKFVSAMNLAPGLKRMQK